MLPRTVCAAVGLVATWGTPLLAHPHPHLTSANGFASGFVHPWLGLDHLLAAVGVGVLATQYCRSTAWRLPGLFLATMVGGLIASPYLDPLFSGIGALVPVTLIALGVCLCLSKSTPTQLAMVSVGLMGLVHGHTHGTEMVMLGVTPAITVMGLVGATLLLHLIGIGVGTLALRAPQGRRLIPWAGTTLAIVGLGLLTL